VSTLTTHPSCGRPSTQWEGVPGPFRAGCRHARLPPPSISRTPATRPRGPGAQKRYRPCQPWASQASSYAISGTPSSGEPPIPAAWQPLRRRCNPDPRIWKLYGSLSRPDSTHRDPQNRSQSCISSAQTRIPPAAARPRSHFASRRSPVRCRLAPSDKRHANPTLARALTVGVRTWLRWNGARDARAWIVTRASGSFPCAVSSA